MRIVEKRVKAEGLRFSVDEDGKEVGSVYLFLLVKHAPMLGAPPSKFGLMENLYVDPLSRRRGYGKELVRKVIEVARREGCYKLICTSRYERDFVHRLYEKEGFKDWGKEFRLNFGLSSTKSPR